MWGRPITFKSRWEVDADSASVFDCLLDVDRLSKWLPRVFREARELRREGSKRRALLAFRGFLPYTLRVEVWVTPYPDKGEIRIESDGDLAGTGLWKLTTAEEGAAVAFACAIHPKRFFLGAASHLLWPVVVLNHRWVMAQVKRNLPDELCRRAGLAI